MYGWRRWRLRCRRNRNANTRYPTPASSWCRLRRPRAGWEGWALAIKDKADGKPVFFANSYQLTSLYSFYSGEQGYHFSPLNYNGNQYEIWDLDKEAEDQTIALVIGSGEDPKKAIEVDGFKTMYLFEVEDYRSYRNLRFEFDKKAYEMPARSSLLLQGQLVNRTGSTINLDSLVRARPIKLFFYLDGKQTPAEEIECVGYSGFIEPDENRAISFRIKVPQEPGKYFFRFGLDFALGMPEQNSDFIKLEVDGE